MLRRLLPISLAFAALTVAVACSESGPKPTVDPAPVAPTTKPVPEPDLSVVPAAEPEKSEPAPTVNLNTASQEEIKAGVPGIGDKMAYEFEEYRPYVSIAQFRKSMSKYVDAPTIAQYEKHVFVPVDPDSCDAATLAQLPGVTAAEAEALIAKRPFADRDAFLNALVEVVEEADFQGAKSMLTQ